MHEIVEHSTYERLGHDANPSLRGSGAVLADRGTWQPFFASNGFFASWFGGIGQEGGQIESTTI